MPTSLVKFFFWLYLLFLVWADATVTNPADPDLWHRLALGEALFKTGHFPAGDAFSYLADYKDVADHEWGSAVLFYALYSWNGTEAFVVVKLVTLAVTMSLLVRAGLWNRRPTMFLAAFYAVVLLALLPSFQSTVRCMTFTHIFFALWLFWFQCERHGRVLSNWWYAATMIIWANLHGGFTIGLAWLLVVGGLAYWASSASGAPAQTGRAGGHPNTLGSPKKWAIRFLICGLVTLINPFGFQLWVSTGRALITNRTGFDEWAPVSWWPDPMAYPGYKLLLLVLFAALAIRIYRSGWNRLDRPIVILVIIFMVLSLTSARHTSLFAVVAGALAPGLFPREPDVESISNPIHRLGYVAFQCVLIVIPFFSVLRVMPGEELTLRYDSASCPVQAIGYLQRQKIQGNLLVPFNYGSYALWELRGQMRVSMDGRYDLVYRPETYRRVDDFFYARNGWTGLLTNPAPAAILVPMGDAVYPKLLTQPGWARAWHDSTDAVFLPLVK